MSDPVDDRTPEPTAPAAAGAAGMTRRPLRRRPWAGALLLLLGLLVSGGAYSLLAPTAPAQAADGDDASATAGRALFLKNCSSCHGLNGQGTSDGPSLVGVGAASVDFQVGTGRMPLAQQGPQAPRGRVLFPQGEIDDMAAYIATLGPGPAKPSASEVEGWKKGDVALGGEIFRTNCSMCHNYAGSGGALTRGKYAPPLLDTDPKYIIEAMLTGPQNMPVFGDEQLTVKQKQDVIAYIKAVKNDPQPGFSALGAVGPVSEGMFGWLAGIGGLIAAAVWLAQKSK